MQITPTPEQARFTYALEFDGHLDRERLEAAWTETVRRHPILGCRRPAEGEHRWHPATGGGPVVASIQLRPGDRGDQLHLALDHAAMDGHATLYVLETLRDRYRFASWTRSIDWTPRNFGDAATPARLSEVRCRQVMRAAQARWASMPRSHHMRESADAPLVGPEFFRIQLPGELTARIFSRARQAGVTITAVAAGIAAVAWERASMATGPARSSGWLLSNDLRPVLGYAGGIGNISGVDAIWFDVHPGDLDAAIRGANRSHVEMRAAGNFLSSQILSEQSGVFFRQPGAGPLARAAIGWAHDTARYSRILANMGPFQESLIDWGDIRVTDYFAIPAFRNTEFDVVSVSSFGGVLTFLMLIAGSTLTRPFLERIEAELRGALMEAAGDARYA
jgi:hypothetical protein